MTSDHRVAGSSPAGCESSSRADLLFLDEIGFSNAGGLDRVALIAYAILSPIQQSERLRHRSWHRLVIGLPVLLVMAFLLRVG